MLLSETWEKKMYLKLYQVFFVALLTTGLHYMLTHTAVGCGQDTKGTRHYIENQDREKGVKCHIHVSTQSPTSSSELSLTTVSHWASQHSCLVAAYFLQTLRSPAFYEKDSL